MWIVMASILCFSIPVVAMDRKESGERYIELDSIRVDESVPARDPHEPFYRIMHLKQADEAYQKERVAKEARALHQAAGVRRRRAYSAGDISLLGDVDVERAKSSFKLQKAWRDFDQHIRLYNAPDYIEEAMISPAQMTRAMFATGALAGLTMIGLDSYLLHEDGWSLQNGGMLLFFTTGTANFGLLFEKKCRELKQFRYDLAVANLRKKLFENQGGFEQDAAKISALILHDSNQSERLFPSISVASMPRAKKRASRRLLQELKSSMEREGKSAE